MANQFFFFDENSESFGKLTSTIQVKNGNHLAVSGCMDEANNLLGYAIFSIRHVGMTYVALEDIQVLQDYRKQGIGQKLLQYSMQTFKQMRIRVIYASPAVPIEDIQGVSAFLRKNGFALVNGVIRHMVYGLEDFYDRPFFETVKKLPESNREKFLIRDPNSRLLRAWKEELQNQGGFFGPDDFDLSLSSFYIVQNQVEGAILCDESRGNVLSVRDMIFASGSMEMGNPILLSGAFQTILGKMSRETMLVLKVKTDSLHETILDMVGEPFVELYGQELVRAL